MGEVQWPVQTMVARVTGAIPEDGRHGLEPKFDGARCVTFNHGDRVRLQSRQCRSLSWAFPDVATAISEQLPAGTVIDGELVVMTGPRVDFAALQRRLISRHVREPACLVVFDVLAERGRDVRGLPYRERRRLLEDLLPHSREGLALAPMTQDVNGARAWLDEHADLGIEGVVAKRLDHGYRPGLRTWAKVRARTSMEAIVGGVVGPLDAPSTLILGRYDRRGRLRVIGRTHPLAAPARTGLAGLFGPTVGVHPWPTPLPGGRFGLPGTTDPVHHTPVAPTVVVELEVDSAYEYGRFRHGVRFLRTRAELHPTDLPPWPSGNRSGPEPTQDGKPGT